MTLIVVKLYKNNNMSKSKEILSLEFLFPDLLCNDSSYFWINYKSFLQLDGETMNQVFSFQEFKDLFLMDVINNVRIAEKLVSSAHEFDTEGKKNTPLVNDKDLVLAILQSIEGTKYHTHRLSEYFNILNKMLRDDAQIALGFINLDCQSFLKLNDKLKNNPALAIQALKVYRSKIDGSSRTQLYYLKKNYFPIPGAELVDNETFFKEAIAIENSIMDYASKSLKDNMKLMAMYAEMANGNIAYARASQGLQYNKDFVMTCINNGLYLDRVKRIYERRDFNIGLAAISFNGNNISDACDELKKSKKISLFALKKGASLASLYNIFRDDKEVVMEAIKLDGINLLYASPRFREDSKMIALAVSSNGDSLKDLPKKYKADKNLVIKAIKSSRQGSVFSFIHSSLRKDKEFMLQAIEVYANDNTSAPRINPRYDDILFTDLHFEYLDSFNFLRTNMCSLVYAINRELLKDKRFISKAAEICPDLIRYESFPGKKIYKKVAVKIVQANPFLFSYLDRNDEKLALIALKQEPKMASYLGYRLKNKAKFKKYIKK